jgi:hypothetical protein
MTGTLRSTAWRGLENTSCKVPGHHDQNEIELSSLPGRSNTQKRSELREVMETGSMTEHCVLLTKQLESMNI